MQIHAYLSHYHGPAQHLVVTKLFIFLTFQSTKIPLKIPFKILRIYQKLECTSTAFNR